MEKTKASATDIVIELEKLKEILKKDKIINLYHKESKKLFQGTREWKH
jgi:hypothetical protein